MKNNRPSHLVEQMKSLCRKENGFLSSVKLRARKTRFLVEFRAFQNFVKEIGQQFDLAAAGEFYFNFADSGFTGISRFDNAHLSIHSTPGINHITFEIFISDANNSNRLIAKQILEQTMAFFDSELVDENYQEIKSFDTQ